MPQDNNRVIISGRVASVPQFDHEFHGENFFIVYIDVPRLSGVVDTLPVTISEGLMGDFVPMPNEHVTIRGQLRSYNKMVDGVNRLIITLFARQYRLETEALREFINDISLVGYVCKPVAYRTTPFLREIADVLIAVNRSYGKSDYLPCIAWGRNARFAGELPVGQSIHIEGRVQSRIYQKVFDDGSMVERVAYEVSASLIEFAEDASGGTFTKDTLL